jgi:ribonuclease P protein component
MQGRVQDASRAMVAATRTCPQPRRGRRWSASAAPSGTAAAWRLVSRRFDPLTLRPYRRQVCLCFPACCSHVTESSSEQAHVPAEQPSSGEDPRLPPAHAHPCRSCHPLGPSPQGPRRAFRVRRPGPTPVLPGEARLTRSQDFTAAMRGGRRAGRPLVVVHLARDVASEPAVPAKVGPANPAKVGFVTSKAVGPAVVRNRVRRRLRHVMAERLGALPAGAIVVVRALPASAAASSRELATDVDRALSRLVGTP